MNRGTFFKRLFQVAATVAIAPNVESDVIIAPKLMNGKIKVDYNPPTRAYISEIDMKIMADRQRNRFNQ